MGLSFIYAPFFFIGHLFASFSSFPTDGFSAPYQVSIFIGGILYALLGIWLLSKILRHFFNTKIAILSLILIVFSTNYIVHITMYGQNSMSHNYLFTLYAAIIWLTILWHQTRKMKYAILLGLVCGLTILSRPTEIVCLAIPFFWGITNKETAVEKVKLFWEHKNQIILFGLILIIFGSFQFIYWKMYAGKFIYNSYGNNAGEGLDFLSPYILQVLFSFRKGWLIYTPLMILAIIGFIFMFKKNRGLFTALVIYFIFNLYFVSSWTCWWYAQSFSQRALIPSYPVMAIALGFFLFWLNEQKKPAKYGGYFLLAALLALNIFQTIQYHKGIIHADRMTKDYYFSVFGKMHVSEEQRKLLLIDRAFDGSERFNNIEDYEMKLAKDLNFESNLSDTDTLFREMETKPFQMDGQTQFSPAIEVPYYELSSADHAWIRVSAEIFPIVDVNDNPFSLVVNFDHNGYSYKYKAFDSNIMDLKLNEWNKVQFDYLTPEVRRKTNKLKVYFWHRGQSPFYFKNLKIESFVRKN